MLSSCLFCKNARLQFCENIYYNLIYKMQSQWSGSVPIPKSEINLDLTLLGGQSFRWEKLDAEIETLGSNCCWVGVAYDAYWELTQTDDAVNFQVTPLTETHQQCASNYFENLLHKYLRTDFNITAHLNKWKQAHEHFAQAANNYSAVRLLDQEPLENIISFMCSQNNHIRRISSMIQWLCNQYGRSIGSFRGKMHYSFPALAALVRSSPSELEAELRAAKFGYRAKFIAQTVHKILESGGVKWFEKLRRLPYEEARLELVTLPGIGFKVADCICLMSLNHLESVPVDTHIFKVAQAAYMPQQLAKLKAVTPKVYEEIGAHFRNIYGDYAGWAQAVLFCSQLQQFQNKDENEKKPKLKRKKKLEE